MRVRRTLVAGARGLLLAVVSLVGSTVLFVLSVVSIELSVLGVGVLTTPVVLQWARGYAHKRRLWCHEWAGIRVPTAYRPLPPDLPGGLAGRVMRYGALLRDPATWRELLWLLLDMTAGCVLALLPAALLVYSVEGLVMPVLFWSGVELHGYWYAFLPASDETVPFMPPLAVGFFVLALFVNPALLRAHLRFCAAFLTPPKAELAERVARLTETRHDAVDASAAELRRIERDLHDGAQARLVAMGMSLGTIEALIEKDPAKAKQMLAVARASSAEALTELRDLVRGIHPPVLAERGLGDAVRALALRTGLPVEVTVELPGRLAAPVESAAYFAVSELLTNAAKHAGADRVWVDVRYAGGALRIAVTDDGRGGADPAKGSGLRGLERRLGTFDGIVAVSSPAGGPTLVTLEIPCASSSPKTSSS
ncbi:sensor histidine kinase [Streptomyces sp. MST-110588]|uniref:sensor histidine kinase n=1 Tax=Streptomyces sp. MST-110588 TaxID=2833628 RepID=UPI001F5C7585|nr:sensor histidine kinase [Streptomyces sp. MST-110588]UNO42461.1 sensor domain-containing protein [Streptomyces sp. MST-110588]